MIKLPLMYCYGETWYGHWISTQGFGGGVRFDLGASGRTSENNETVLLKYEVLACLFLIRISPRCKISHRYYLHQKHAESMLHWPLPYGEFFFVHQSIVTGRREAQSLWHYIRVEEQRQFIVAFINRRFHFNTPFHWDRTVRQFLDWVADAGLGSFVNIRLDRRTSAGCLPHTPVACP